ADASPQANLLADVTHALAFRRQPVEVGGVKLPHPLMLAAGFVKGHGFTDEASALQAVQNGVNIIPGWRSVPKLLGIVEIGSFTRYPRIGNPGTVIWRDVSTQSTQNRVGLRNPGAEAAATFLQRNIVNLPLIFGINIAASPGVEDDEQAAREVTEAVHAFVRHSIVPNWFTLNISCPNTEDDPEGQQTEQKTRSLCKAVQEQIRADGYNTPLWVKVSPGLSAEQYRILMRVFVEENVKAVIATNTLGQPTPDGSGLQAGVGGGRLAATSLQAADILQDEKLQQGYAVDIVGCGGITSHEQYLKYKARGIQAVQYWSALVYQGPLAAALIESGMV
ncbi:MAG: hypothetical protein KC496_17110, partial [Anaerolineae bacterium]|nr:hypothetical protein [Anaerolineae bacterium]